MTTNTNCPVTAGRATAIHTGLARQAPVRPKKACERLSTNASMSEKIPSSGAIVVPGRFVFEGCSHFGRHVFLVVLGQHLVRDECARAVHRAVRDDALPL